MSKIRTPISIFALQTPEQRERIQRLGGALGKHALEEASTEETSVDEAQTEEVAAEETPTEEAQAPSESRGLHAISEAEASAHAQKIKAAAHAKEEPKDKVPAHAKAEEEEESSNQPGEADETFAPSHAKQPGSAEDSDVPEEEADEEEAGNEGDLTAEVETEADAQSEADAEESAEDSETKTSVPAHAKKPNESWQGQPKIIATLVALALLVGVGVGFSLGQGSASTEEPNQVIAVAEGASATTEGQEEQSEELKKREANVQARYKILGIDEADRVLAENLDPITVYPVETQPVAELSRIADIDVSTGTHIKLDVPIVNQLDTSNEGRSLMSGCEVASLAMLLQYSGVDVTKEQLQDEMPTVGLYDENGYAGNPNYAFVGEMEGASTGGVGYSVYHAPVAALAQKHILNLPYEVVDLTGQNFTVMLKELADGNPCWIITTESFQPYLIPEVWQTEEGPVTINWELHSVVVTGYDDDSIYINDPYGYTQNVPYDRTAFEEAWKIMGSQCVTIVPRDTRALVSSSSDAKSGKKASSSGSESGEKSSSSKAESSEKSSSSSTQASQQSSSSTASASTKAAS